MAANSTTERTIKTKLDASGGASVSREAKQAERALKSLQRTAEENQKSFVRSADAGSSRVLGALGAVTKGMFAVGSAASSAQGLVGAAGALATLSGVALAVPGALLVGASAVGVMNLALMGFSDAVTAKDAKAWTEATKDMAPAAVDTARAIRDQNKNFTELRRTVQGGFFEGFDGDVRSLAEKYFPLLNKETGAIAGNLNKMGREVSKALFEPQSVAEVEKILRATDDTLIALRPAAANFLRGLLNLGGVGAQRTVALGKAVTDLSTRFEKMVDEGVKSGKINKLIDDGIKTAKQFGQVGVNVGQIWTTVWSGLSTGGGDFLGRIVKSTQAVEDFLHSAEGQSALRELGLTLSTVSEVASGIFNTAIRQVAPIVREIAPAAREVAVAVGDFLVNAFETAGPIIKDVATFLSDNKEAVGELVPIILGLAVAYKGLRVAQDIRGWVEGAVIALDNFGKKADIVGEKIGDGKSGKGLAGRLGGLRAVAGVAAIGTAAVALDELNTSAAGAEEKLSVTDDALHNVVGAGKEVASLNFRGIFQELKDEWQQMIDFGNKAKNDAARNRVSGIKVKVEADTFAAQLDLNKLMNAINKSSGTVNINGNDNPAAFALRRVLEEIKQGKETVTINGQSVPAQDALRQIIDQINLGTGTVDMNGNTVPAGAALTEVLRRIGASTADVNVGANTSAAQGVINSFIQRNDGRTVQIYTSVLGSGGLASAGRLAGGGRPFFSGPVTGPGSGTSDTAGLFALSNGEHVLRDAEVRAAGGHAAIFAWRRSLMSGVRGLADGGVPTYLTRSMPQSMGASVNVSTTSAAPEVKVFLGSREITDVVRTELEYHDRQKRRTAATGPGGAW